MIRLKHFTALMICITMVWTLNAVANPLMIPVAGQLAKRATKLHLVEYVQTSWTTKVNSKATASFAVKTGDVLVAYAAQGADNCAPLTTISGGGLTWTLIGEVNTWSGSWAPVFIWSATATSTTSFALTFSWANSSGCNIEYGGGVFTFRNSSGVGVAAGTNTTGVPSLSYTTTTDGSAVIILAADWNAVDGSSRQWLQSPIETNYTYASGGYTVYGGYIPNAGSAGARTVGLTAPSGQKYSIIALEVKP